MSDQIDSAEDFLAHFGVKGMKWGRRKKPEDDGKRFTEKEALKAAGVDDLLKSGAATYGKTKTSKVISQKGNTPVSAAKAKANSSKIKKDLQDLLESETGEKIVFDNDFDVYF
jgi:hypothetical protein